MPPPTSRTMVVPSILDRLTGLQDRVSLADLKILIRRDLENLLNTRWRCKSFPPDLRELDLSLANYGLPDFSGAVLSNEAGIEDLRRTIEGVIRRFEPRLSRVSVKIRAKPTGITRDVAFDIDATLQADPAPPQDIVLSSSLDPVTAMFHVERTG